MKLYIFQETGEFRVAEDGEWYQDVYGDFILACGPTYKKMKIVVMTEVDFPYSTSRIQITPYEGLPTPWPMPAYTTILSIVRSKRKVKKWQYLWRHNDSSTHYLTPLPSATWEDALAECITVVHDSFGNPVPVVMIERVEGSMVEVEE